MVFQKLVRGYFTVVYAFFLCRASILVFFVIFLGGCGTLRQSLQNQSCGLDSFQPYDTVHIDPAHYNITLHWKDPVSQQPFKTIEHVIVWLESRGDSVIAVTNAGIYEPGLTPTGLYVEKNQELNPLNLKDGYGNFYLKPNGVFYVSDHQFGILESTQFDEQGLNVEYALQSGPLLLENQTVHPEFTLGSKNCRLRSGIGVTNTGHAIIAISNGAVNFYDFATWFRDDVGAVDALYLDGSISELYINGWRRGHSEEMYAGFLAVTFKSE